MNRSDRRRAFFATALTVVALPAVWLMNREEARQAAAPPGATVAQTAPSTTAYEPEAPVFVGGEDQPTQQDVINIAVAPAPTATDVRASASYRQFPGTLERACTAVFAPDATLLTITNVDNGQSTTCTNSLIVAPPRGVDIVLDTEVYVEIADVADAPTPVRVSW